MRTSDHAIVGSTAGELVASVRAQVDAGMLKPGVALPSIRALASELGVNRNTVAAAYAQLAGAGVVETRRRGGTVILGIPDVDGEGRIAGGELVNLASGNPDPAFLPPLTGVVDAGYAPPLYGAAPVTDELAAWAAAHMAADAVEPHRFLVTHGAVDAVERLLSAHLTRGDVVAVEDPCFLSSIGILRLGGYRSAPIPVDAEGMTVDGLRAALTAGARAVVCTPRAHNPTGASLTPERAAALREVLADHHGVLIIEDDHFSAISAQPYARITPPDAQRWALVRSVSKFLGPDMRVALVLADPETALRLESRLSTATTWVSHILQHLVAGLLTDPNTASLLSTARSAYAERSQLLVTALSSRGIPVQGNVDGLNVWVPLSERPQSVVADLAARGWAVRPSQDFGVTDRPPLAIRVTTATLTPQQAANFADDLAAAVQP